MGRSMVATLLTALAISPTVTIHAKLDTKPVHEFRLGKKDFLLDGKPLQIMSGEMHPARIPSVYWRHRIQMAKAMGCNTIAAYLFWNYLEPQPGKFDFKTENRDVAKFFRICQEEGMWVILRPGPYVCGEWELGGIPPYLLRIPDIKLRCMDPRYTQAVDRYIGQVASRVKPLLVANGGPILMVQVENEYGSYGNDRTYMEWLRKTWVKHGVAGPVYTADGPTEYMLEAGSLPGAAVGLDSGGRLGDWDLAERMNPGVPVFSSETYPGWLTHWGENWASASTEGISEEVKFLLDNRKSFNLYVIHGGTNFGFTAGANSGGKGYEPDVTSYDYDAPIGEQGNATAKYTALRELIQRYRSTPIPAVPAAIPAISIPPITMENLTSVWDNLPAPQSSPQPKPFEAYGQDYGFRLYRTRLVGHHYGRLSIKDLHDYATVFLDGKYIGKLDRRLGESTITIPGNGNAQPTLDILTEGMGRINFADALIDRKGITDRVTLNGMTLMTWESYGFPMESPWVEKLKPSAANDRPGQFFRGEFTLSEPADTFLDLSAYTKGVAWVNGHNLGRFWEIGPQKRLYCPAPFLRKGKNEVRIFDLHQLTAKPVQGWPTLK